MFEASQVGEMDYLANFSQLHAEELVFDSPISMDLKRSLARRMLAYPVTLDHIPLLRFGLRQLADDTLISHALYYAAWPLGEMEVHGAQA